MTTATATAVKPGALPLADDDAVAVIAAAALTDADADTGADPPGAIRPLPGGRWASTSATPISRPALSTSARKTTSTKWKSTKPANW